MATDAPRPIARNRRAGSLNGIYVILNEGTRLMELARAVLDGGIRLVQYRAKDGIVADNVRALRVMTSDRDALLILNDDWRAALKFECDGVHLGPGDDGFDQVCTVRMAIGERLIGLSCATLDEVRSANSSDADYIGVGSVYATTSKPDAGAPIGLDGLRKLVSASTLPVAAIGGVSAAAIAHVRQTGCSMVAVIGAIANATDPRRAARELVEAWHR